MGRMKTIFILVSIFLLAFVLYSCATDDEAESISDRIAQFCGDYNNSSNSIKNNFAPGSSLSNSDILYWNTFFGGSAANHVSIKYSIVSEGPPAQVSIICSKYPSGHAYTFSMTKDGDNWKISSIY
jgi:hypothetical protein